MNSLKLGEATFNATIDSNETLVVRFVLDDQDAVIDKGLAGMFPNSVFAHVNVGQEPALSRMFSLTNEPGLVIFRQRIILLCEKGQHDSEKLGYLLQKISMLDMDKVRSNIEKEKAAEALHMRRACPTVRAKMM